MMKSPVESPSTNASIATPLVVSKTPFLVSSHPATSADSVGDKESPGSSDGISQKKRARVDTTANDDELREERKAANRRSAYQSRLRKKLLTEQLQGQVSKLTNELSSVRHDNESLSRQFESALAENRHLRFAQQDRILMGGSVGMNLSEKLSDAGGLRTRDASILALLARDALGGGFNPSAFPFRR
jgi:hypothetical protein